MHPALGVALRHLLVQDAAARRHPLDVAGAERAAVAETVAVLDGAVEHIGDRLDAAVRMPREPGEVILRAVVAEIVEQEERVEGLGLAEAEGAVELHPGAFRMRLGLDDLVDGSQGHLTVSLMGSII